nr:PcfJ domain-containing protein [Clostridium sp. D33t1_170424_F3]
MGRIERFYRDYLQECLQLRLNLCDRQILFPRDLHAAHERTMAQIKFEKNKADQEAFAAQVAKLERWVWEQDGLFIRPARTQEELAREGAALHHCVGGYIQRMASGETAIFFIRRAEAPDTPFYTLELQSRRVVQCRTDHNDSYANHPEVKAFVDAWLAQIVTARRKKTQSKKKKTAAA